MLFSLAVLSFISLIEANNTPAACANPSAISQSPRPTATSAATCQNACLGSTYRYAYFDPSTNTCGCDEFGPVSNDVLVEDPRSCAAGEATAYRLVGTFQIQGCSEESVAGANPINTVSSLEDCFQFCGPGVTAAIVPSPGTGSSAEFTCGCYATAAISDFSSCFYLVFTHTAGAQVSGIYRRDERIRREARKARMGLCPAGRVACLTSETMSPSISDPFECLDPMTELESCGGCIHGAHPSTNSTLGINCESLPGTKLGAVSCIRGSCKVKACDRGYTLINGVCV